MANSNTKKEIDDNKILELKKQGLLHREIAEIIGCATGTITQHLNKMGVKTYNMDRRKQVLELHNQGLYDREIAERLNITREDVTHLLNVQGVHNRRSKIDDINLRNRISNSLIGRYTGVNNPNYKGGTNERKLARGIFKTFSKRLMREADYTCQRCGKRGGDLETHHIKHFSKIMDEFLQNAYSGNINTLYEELMNYPDFIDESNMVVLCHDCHMKMHSKDNHELSLSDQESATTIERAC